MVALGNKNRIWNGLAILLGTGLMATAVNCVFEPMQLVTGGVTGIGIIIKELTRNIIGEEGVPLWLTNLLCNIPLFVFAYYILGKRFLRRGILSAIVFTVYLGVIPITQLPTGDTMLNSVLGAVLMGLGLGLVFAVGSTTGGMDLLAVLLQTRFRYLTEAQILAVVDGAIVIAGGIIFGLENALYALVAIFIVTRVSDSIMNGLKFSKVGYVISDQAEEISQRIMSELQRGITGIDITGMHTGARKNMLMCVVSRKQIVELKEIVFEIDPKAFVIVTDANETVGEGFLNYRAE
ncbi:MAG: YitT family protein [Lachnospiraceae bacterium]|nr:YitT family protein [Lachnospiraceae bacterium]